MRGWRQQWLPLALSLAAVAQCNAVTARPRRGKDQSDEAVAPSPVRKWLDRPATKGAILVVAGGVSGAIAKTATAPLERAKLMSQAGQTANFLQLMGEVVKVEGWRGLWRGNMANVIRVVPNKGVLLMCSDMYKAGVRAALPGCGGATISSVAGGLAGLTAVLCTYPLELVRTRMAYRICDSLSCADYSSVWSTLRSVVSTNGVLGLYNGVGMTLIGALPFEGIKFGLYDTLNSRLPRDEQGRVAPLWKLLTGATAGALAHTFTYPLDTLRRRMQISGATGATTYTSISQCVRLVITAEGFGALWYGLAPTVIRSLPNLGIQFLLYELLKTALGYGQPVSS